LAGTVRYGTVIALCFFPCSFSFVPLLCCVVLCVLRVVGVDKPGISGGRPACVVPYVVVCAFLPSLWFCFVQVSLLTSLSLSLIPITHTSHTTIEWNGITRDCNVSVRFESLKCRCF